MIGDKLNAKTYFLFAPTFVKNPLIKEEYLKEESIREVFEQIESCDVVFLSIGEVSKYSSSLKTTLIDESDYEEILELGGVGNISLRYFDENGNILDCDLNKSVMGIEPETFKKIPEVVCMAGGTEKERSLKAALKGRYINTLITDEETAKNILSDNK
jgi:DNA-binding transcriptional regulator LsrR (DeoR family)